MTENIPFNKLNYQVLKCGTKEGYGYYDDNERTKIAFDLMEKGLFLKSPKHEWSNSGWKATAKGEKLFIEFAKKLQELHGHIWKTNIECIPEIYEKGDVYANQVNDFAFSSGHHNGPECKNCGYSYCRHCKSEFDIPKCTKEKIKMNELDIRQDERRKLISDIYRLIENGKVKCDCLIDTSDFRTWTAGWDSALEQLLSAMKKKYRTGERNEDRNLQ